jgi:replicative DNA helicase
MKFDDANPAEFERALLGQMLVDPSCYDEAGLDPEHFLDPKNKTVLAAIKELREAGRQVDEMEVGDAIPPERFKKIGGYSYLSGLTSGVSTTSNASFYAKKIRDAWLKRECAGIHGEVARLASRGSSGEEILQMIRSTVDQLEGLSSHQFHTMADGYESEVEKIRRERELLSQGIPFLTGIPTGLGIENVVPGGIPVDKVTTIFGESGNFKTTTKNSLVWGMADSGLGSVLDISLEDSDQLTVQRFIARQTGINYGAVATRDLNDEQEELIGSISERAIETAGRVIQGGDICSIDEVVRLARHLKRTRGLMAVVIDYVQLMDEDGREERLALKHIFRTAQLAAKRDRIAYVFVSQVGQEVDKRAQDKRQSSRPRINDMIGSSWLKIASKLQIGVYRPAKYDPVPKKPLPGEPDYTPLLTLGKKKCKVVYESIVELHIVKNILGEAGVIVPIMVQAETGRMIPMPEKYKEMIK